MMRVKTLTLWQPWASLIIGGHKQYETRSWSTTHRQTLVIHAAQRFNWESRETCFLELYARALAEMGLNVDTMPLGVCLGVVDLVGVYNTNKARERLTEKELVFGDFTPGRFAWKMENVRAFPEPVLARGARRLWWWNVPDTLREFFE